jgi:hypothetical protein
MIFNPAMAESIGKDLLKDFLDRKKNRKNNEPRLDTLFTNKEMDTLSNYEPGEGEEDVSLDECHQEMTMLDADCRHTMIEVSKNSEISIENIKDLLKTYLKKGNIDLCLRLCYVLTQSKDSNHEIINFIINILLSCKQKNIIIDKDYLIYLYNNKSISEILHVFKIINRDFWSDQTEVYYDEPKRYLIMDASDSNLDTYMIDKIYPLGNFQLKRMSEKVIDMLNNPSVYLEKDDLEMVKTPIKVTGCYNLTIVVYSKSINKIVTRSLRIKRIYDKTFVTKMSVYVVYKSEIDDYDLTNTIIIYNDDKVNIYIDYEKYNKKHVDHMIEKSTKILPLIELTGAK